MRPSALSATVSCATAATSNETAPEPAVPKVVRSTWDGGGVSTRRRTRLSTSGPTSAAGTRSPAPSRPSPPAASASLRNCTPDFALVQPNNFTTLFVLSRQQNPEETLLTQEAWIARAGQLGSNLDDVVKTDQTGCKFT
ncbi:hypothetical protein LY76DRAFT_639048 [Colletotrichum caudatum]|nr:hypothetical protein LY76DRAFT_639048 [Colletotrichum caudatum]